MKLEELRKKHPRFIYQDYRWRQAESSLTIQFQFLLEPDITFTPQITIAPLEKAHLENLDREQLDQWVFHLGMIELFSYWKAAAPAEIVVQAGWLNEDQLAWWKQLLLDGMGEFFYTNQLDFTAADFVKISCEAAEKATQKITAEQVVAEQIATERSVNQRSASQENRQQLQQATVPYLVPVGGGKDSALVVELLEENGLPYDILLSHPQSPAAKKIAGLSRANNIIELRRTFDPQLFALNKAGYLNGHTPFSARLAFESSLIGFLLGHRQILLANEFSANEGNVPFHGMTVNHQYSKTFDFESKFRSYVAQHLTLEGVAPTPEYLSLLRPLHELQIAALFAQYSRFHPIFKSCNREQQQENWCCECPKCLFVFTALYPFLEEKELIGPIFPENMFEKTALQPTLTAMLGKDQHKPFECIGTYEETLAAFQLSIEHFQKQHPDTPLPPILAFVEETILAKESLTPTAAQDILCSWNDNHFLDEKLTTIIHEAKQRICQ